MKTRRSKREDFALNHYLREARHYTEQAVWHDKVGNEDLSERFIFLGNLMLLMHQMRADELGIK